VPPLYHVHDLSQFPDNAVSAQDSAFLSKRFGPAPLCIPVRLRELNGPRTEGQVNYVTMTRVLPAADDRLKVNESKGLIHGQVYGHDSGICVLMKV